MKNPTNQQIRNVLRRLPSDHKRIFLYECVIPAMHPIHQPTEELRFLTETLGQDERNILIGLSRRDLVRVRLFSTGSCWDPDPPEDNIPVPGWKYEGVITPLGQELAKILDEDFKRYLEEFRWKQKTLK
jgi:hypothetical protein